MKKIFFLCVFCSLFTLLLSINTKAYSEDNFEHKSDIYENVNKMGKTIFNIIRYWSVILIILFSALKLQYIMIGLYVIASIINCTNIYGYKLKKEERRNMISTVFLQIILLFFAILSRESWYAGNFLLIISIWIHIFSTEFIRKKMNWKLPFQK